MLSVSAMLCPDCRRSLSNGKISGMALGPGMALGISGSIGGITVAYDIRQRIHKLEAKAS